MTPRVLVVDDAADVRLLMREVCGLIGAETEEAASGRAALDHLAASPVPDLILLDVQMPELDGWDTLAEIRGDERTSDVPVILCSVRSQPLDVERARRLGANEVVTKPFGVADLADAVRRTLEAGGR